jgi:hypothetical protein
MVTRTWFFPGQRQGNCLDAHVIRIAQDFTLLDTDSSWPREDIGFSEARWNEYRALFNKMGLAEGMIRTEDFPGAILFVARVKGLCIGGSSAGFAYSEAVLSPIVASVEDALKEELRKDPKKHGDYVFKRLKANWYAFYQVDW